MPGSYGTLVRSTLSLPNLFRITVELLVILSPKRAGYGQKTTLSRSRPEEHTSTSYIYLFEHHPFPSRQLYNSLIAFILEVSTCPTNTRNILTQRGCGLVLYAPQGGRFTSQQNLRRKTPISSRFHHSGKNSKEFDSIRACFLHRPVTVTSG